MAERFLNRAFNAAFSKVEKALPAEPLAPATEAEPETAPDAIQRILQAWEKKEYFKMLGLPEPEADELGRPVWEVGPSEVSKAYRKLSVLVHPDKNPGDDARKAFEALNETHRILKDPSRLSELLKEMADRLRRDRERLEASASAGQRIAMNATKNAKQREMRKEEGRSFHNKILEQMQRKQEEAKRKKELMERGSAYQRQRLERGEGLDRDGDGGSGAAGGGPGRGAGKTPAGGSRNSDDEEKDSDEDDEEEERRRALKRRKKPTFMH